MHQLFTHPPLSVMIFREFATLEAAWCFCTPVVFHQHIQTAVGQQQLLQALPSSSVGDEEDQLSTVQRVCKTESYKLSFPLPWGQPAPSPSKMIPSLELLSGFSLTSHDSQRKQIPRHHFLVNVLLYSYKTSFIPFIFASMKIQYKLQDSGSCNYIFF